MLLFDPLVCYLPVLFPNLDMFLAFGIQVLEVLDKEVSEEKQRARLATGDSFQQGPEYL